jgi:hypothetical protein
MWPTFLGIGSMRCGSTWLYEVLRHHPQIRMSDPKQLEFFNRHILHRDFGWYRRFFEPEPNEQPKPVRGEITPFYARLKPRNIVGIQRVMPDLRIVLVIRHPIERVWSHALYDLGAYKERDVNRLSPSSFLRHFQRSRTRRYTNYDWILETWTRVFGNGSVHVGLFDDLIADPGSLVSGVLAHIGADPSWRIPEELVGKKVLAAEDLVGGQVEMPEMLRWYLAVQWQEPMRRLNARLEGRISHWVDELDTLAREGRLSWRVQRQVNRFVMSMPERLAFATYDRWRDARLARRWRSLLGEYAKGDEADGHR